MVKENYEEIEKRVCAACERAGRDRSEVTLIAVSKTKPLEALKEAYEAGAREFGENKVQELMDKIPELPEDIKWHMIGHLQRNKVKYLARYKNIEMIHSVDSYRLAEEINIHGKKSGRVFPILIEVNAAGEESKFGVAPEETLQLCEEISKLDAVSIKGLMTIAPFVADPQQNRPVFKRMKQLSVDIAAQNIDNVSMDILSMGMSNDFEVAIEEGATHVRVGTSIFGERNYNI
ncbi:MAG: YggS family pyridoxal phosphate-dependent enzyme [Lachnospiraceae bacterium]|nr:YggS family pyridoxal phosphate-dependent enzyme [Lachnospiraceae bacterium]